MRLSSSRVAVLMLIRPGSEPLSMRAATLTVSPQTSKQSVDLPIMPATALPLAIPILTLKTCLAACAAEEDGEDDEGEKVEEEDEDEEGDAFRGCERRRVARCR